MVVEVLTMRAPVVVADGVTIVPLPRNVRELRREGSALIRLFQQLLAAI
jgi:hypothetical protein